MKIALHLDTAVNWRIDNVAWSIEDHADFFIHVHEYLIFFVFPYSHLRSIRRYGIRWKYVKSAPKFKKWVFVLNKLIDDERSDKLSWSELWLPEIDDLV